MLETLQMPLTKLIILGQSQKVMAKTIMYSKRKKEKETPEKKMAKYKMEISNKQKNRIQIRAKKMTKVTVKAMKMKVTQ